MIAAIRRASARRAAERAAARYAAYQAQPAGTAWAFPVANALRKAANAAAARYAAELARPPVRISDRAGFALILLSIPAVEWPILYLTGL